MPGGSRSPVMASVPGKCFFCTAGYAALPLCQLGFTADIVYCALRQIHPVFERFNRSLPLAPGDSFYLLGGALTSKLLSLCGFAGFHGLFFANGAGALIRAHNLPVSRWVEPLTAFFIGALAAR